MHILFKKISYELNYHDQKIQQTQCTIHSVFAGFYSHDNSIYNIIPILKKENVQLGIVTWNHIIVYKLFLLKRNTCYHIIVNELLVSDRNTWNHITVCKPITIIDKEKYNLKRVIAVEPWRYTHLWLWAKSYKLNKLRIK